jgi:hypothetical protein
MGMRGKALVVFLLILLFCTDPWLPVLAGRGLPAPPQRDLPAEQPFFDAVRDNLARSSREQVRYAYKERRTELHTNPFGRLGTGDVVLYDVTPGSEPAVTLRTLLERNGNRITDSKPERQERKVRTQGPSSVDDTVAALQFSIARRESVNGRSAIVVRFEPRSDAKPQTREGKLAKTFRGLIWVDETAREVMRVEATAADDLSYGLGLIAKISKGTVVTLIRERIDDHVWLPTSTKFKANGRALFAIRKINFDFAVEWFDYRRQ